MARVLHHVPCAIKEPQLLLVSFAHTELGVNNNHRIKLHSDNTSLQSTLLHKSMSYCSFPGTTDLLLYAYLLILQTTLLLIIALGLIFHVFLVLFSFCNE